ncbi:hypothetical protein BG004_004601 [Podila humilis]|nr:hypothetical protein BG004_004601 [Podila humilis]
MAPIHKHANRVKVILTGFEPFGKHTTNPSWLSVKPLHNTVLDLTPLQVISENKKTDDHHHHHHHQATQALVICQELPVEYRKVPDLVPLLHAQHTTIKNNSNNEQQQNGQEKEEVFAKTYFIHVGVGRDGHTAIETLANRTGYGAPDNAQWQPESKTTAPVPKEEWNNDPEVLNTTVDTAELAKFLTEEKGWICQQSLDAGHYLCEYTFYLSMAERHRRLVAGGQEKEDDRTCLFVHLPSVGNPYSLEELQKFIVDMVKRVASVY